MLDTHVAGKRVITGVEKHNRFKKLRGKKLIKRKGQNRKKKKNK